MTFEELKEEAKRQGYDLIKQPTYIPLKKCPCGVKLKIRHYYTFNSGQYYKCINCGLEGEYAKTTKEARTNWNKAVESAINNKEKSR